jgi:hypothetical protein
VFSAREPNPDFNGLPYRDRHTDYKIFTADGKQLFETVRNDDHRLVGSPRKVELPVGTYRVLARANGYGLVTVPVVIQPHQVTAVHLEGSYWWSRASGIFEDDPVRLPSGEIAGWRGRQVAKPRKSWRAATKRQRSEFRKTDVERRA